MKRTTVDIKLTVVRLFDPYRKRTPQNTAFLNFFNKRSLFNSVFKSLTSLESRNFACGNLNLCAGLRILAFSCSSFSDFKITKANQRNLVAVSHGSCDYIKSCVDNLFCVFFGNACLFGNCCDEFCLVHFYTSSIKIIGLQENKACACP